MDWKIFIATFTAVFFAEMADKTQMVGIGMASKSAKPLTVFFGSVCAYMVITAVSVLIGATLGKYIKPEIIKYCGASLFIILGVLMLFGKL
jgi:Ca2+/H+ antiporter, TMEM165/GDT1 family